MGCVIFVALLVNVLNNKCDNKMEALIISNVYLFLMVGILSGVYEIFKIPVYLVTLYIGIGIIDAIILLSNIFKAKNIKRQQKQIDKKYIWAVITIGLLVFGICVYHYGVTLKLTYGDVDAVRYFLYAMDIVKNKNVSGEFVTPLWIAIFIELIRPIIQEVFLYKGMIMAHICMQVLVAVMFFVLACKVNHKKYITNIIITILFWSGYQLYILTYGTFLHWEDGILIIMFLIYHILDLQKSIQNRTLNIIGILIGVLGLALCYPFFGIILIFLIVPEIINWMIKKENRKYFNLKISSVFIILLCLGGLTGIYYMKQRVGSMQYLFSNFSSEGLAYKEPYMDFLFFIPVLFIAMVIINKDKENKIPKSIFRMCISALIFIVFWIFIYIQGYLSNYYYYRNYYVLWMLAWLMTAQVVGILIDNKQQLFVMTYCSLYSICILISVIGVDKKIYNYNPELYLEDPGNRLLTPLYAFNFDNLKNDRHITINEQLFNIYNYRIKNLNNKDVPMITSQWSILNSQWYTAICSLAGWSETYSIESESLVSIAKTLDSGNFQYVLVQKDDPEVYSYGDLMQKKWNVEVETENAIIFKKPSAGWISLTDGFEKITDESWEAENYIIGNIGYNKVMLVCEGTYGGKGDVREYSAYVGENTLGYVGRFLPDNFLESTYVLNNENVSYVAVYMDSDIYLENKEYFDDQKTVFQNGLIKIIMHKGEGWMPSQQ